MSGRVDFPYQLDQDLLNDYDGVISFTFDETASEASFLYHLGAGSVSLRSMPTGALVGKIVNHNYLLYSPAQIFKFEGPRLVRSEAEDHAAADDKVTPPVSGS